jgi:hypothetical protein
MNLPLLADPKVIGKRYSQREKEKCLLIIRRREKLSVVKKGRIRGEAPNRVGMSSFDRTSISLAKKVKELKNGKLALKRRLS